MAMCAEISFFWGVTLISMVNSYQRLKKPATSSYLGNQGSTFLQNADTSVPNYKMMHPIK
jgi:hypothetical protein